MPSSDTFSSEEHDVIALDRARVRMGKIHLECAGLTARDFNTDTLAQISSHLNVLETDLSIYRESIDHELSSRLDRYDVFAVTITEVDSDRDLTGETT